MTIKEVTCGLVDPNQGEVYQGQEVDLRAQITNEKGTLITKEEDLVKFNYEWTAAFGSYSAAIAPKNPNRRWEATLKTAGVELGIYTVTVKVVGDANSKEGTKTV